MNRLRLKKLQAQAKNFCRVLDIRVPKRMATEMGKQYRFLFAFHQYCIITVPNDPSDGLVQRSLVVCAAIPVKEYEIRISVNGHPAFQPDQFLIFLFSEERILYHGQHRHLPFAGFCFRRMDIEVAPLFTALIPVIVVHQGVIDIDNTFFHINVAPPKSGHLSHPEACADHHRKNRIPMAVYWMILQKIQEQVLFRSGQPPTLLRFEDVGLLQFL